MAEQQQAFATPHVTPLKIQLNDKQQTPPSAHEKTNRSQSTSFSTARFAVKKTKLPLNLETLQQHQLGPAGTKISQRKNEIDKLITSVLTSPKTQDAASFRSHASIISGKKLFGDQTTGILSTKAKLCVESLSEGCIDAFVLLFDLIHKPKDTMEQDFKIPIQKLVMIKQLLCDAETNRRLGDFEAVYFTYKKLADYFEAEKYEKTAMFFYNGAQDVAKASSDPVLESIAYEHIGAYYARCYELEKAIKSYEMHLSLLDPSKDDMVHKARNTIVATCMKLAQQKEEEELFHESIVHYEKALKLSAVASNQEMASKCIFHLGKLYEKMQDYERSVNTITQYLQDCVTRSDIHGQLDAIQLLATICEKTNPEKALELHTQYLQLAEASKNLEKQACQNSLFTHV